MEYQVHESWTLSSRKSNTYLLLELSTTMDCYKIISPPLLLFSSSSSSPLFPLSSFSSSLPEHDDNRALAASDHHQSFPYHQSWRDNHAKVQNLVEHLWGCVRVEGVRVCEGGGCEGMCGWGVEENVGNGKYRVCTHSTLSSGGHVHLSDMLVHILATMS